MGSRLPFSSSERKRGARVCPVGSEGAPLTVHVHRDGALDDLVRDAKLRRFDFWSAGASFAR